MNEEGMMKPALIGGVLIGVLSSVPFLNIPCCCCAWVVGGGALAAYVYVRECKSRVTLGRGVALGALAGAIGAVVNALFLIPRLLISKSPVAEQFSRAIEQVPNVPEETRQLIATVLAREGMIEFLIIASFFVILFVYCLLSMLGGAIGVAFFEKRSPGAEAPPAILPPPPPPPIL